MTNNLPKRKSPRLKDYNYSAPGAYFITICVKGRKCMLSQIIVGTGVLDCPQNKLTPYGEIVDKYICQMSDFYNDITVDKYVVMPNHIHLLIRVADNPPTANGQSGTLVPTIDRKDRANAVISRFVSTLKRFCNKEFGENIWQARCHDHIIRDKNDYRGIWEYIDTNVLRWDKDCFYVTE